MKRKSILITITEEEYEIIRKLTYEDAIKSNKKASITGYTSNIVKNHININGNRPPPEKPYIESPEKPHNTVLEPLQDSVIESPEKPSIKESKNNFGEINWDF